MLKLVSWNVGGRSATLPDQVRCLGRTDADVICLQEVRASTLDSWRRALERDGLEWTLDSRPGHGRPNFNLIGSRWPLEPLGPFPELPQPERLLSATALSPYGPVEIHNLHVPPNRGRGRVKEETLAAISNLLSVPYRGHRVLCGDFNTASRETRPGEERAGRWVEAEGLLLRGLGAWGLVDVYRHLHGYDSGEVTCSRPGHHRRSGNRLDHVLASPTLGAVHCEYQNGWRQEGFSDHSAVEVIFDPPAAPTRQEGRSVGPTSGLRHDAGRLV